jgi:hypothetical protein
VCPCFPPWQRCLLFPDSVSNPERTPADDFPELAMTQPRFTMGRRLFVPNPLACAIDLLRTWDEKSRESAATEIGKVAPQGGFFEDAQALRPLAYEARGRVFESPRAYQLHKHV